jgi:hypothetical protein
MKINGISLEEKKDVLFFSMLNGNTVQETITTSRGEFVVKYPRQTDLITIGVVSAFMRCGLPAANFNKESDYEIQKCATLDVVVETGPEWFSKLRKAPDFSWRNIPDSNFVDEVYAKVLTFQQNVNTVFRGSVGKTADKKTNEDMSGAVPSDGIKTDDLNGSR